MKIDKRVKMLEIKMMEKNHYFCFIIERIYSLLKY